MSQLDTNDIASRVRTGGTPDVGRIGVQGTLQSPGLVPVSDIPNVQQQKMFDDLLNAIGGVVGELGSQAQRERRELERQQGKREAEGRRTQAEVNAQRRREEAVQRLVAASHADAAADTLATQIKAGETGRLDEETIQDAVERMIANEKAGRDKISGLEFERRLRPKLTAAFNDFEVAAKKDAGEQLTSLLTERANSVETEDELQQLLEQSREIPPLSGLGESERQLDVFEGALRTAANDGNVEKFEFIAKVADQLPGRLVSEQRFKAESRQLRRIRLREQQAVQEIRESHRLQPDRVEQDIADRVKSGEVTPGAAASLLTELTGLTKADRARAIDLQQRANILDATAELSVTGAASTGGLNSLTQDIPYIVDGEVKKYPIEQLKKDVVNREVSRILADDSKEEDARLTEAFTYLARNSETYPPFTAAMESAASLTIADFTGDQVPDAGVRGFQVFNAMREQAPELLAAHIKESSTRDFLEDWRSVNRHITQGDVQAAAVFAKEANKPENRARFATNFDAKQMTSAVRDVTNRFLPESLGGGDVKNVNDVRATIGRIAELQMKRLGISHKDAVENAAEVLNGKRQTINGWWVDTSTRPLPSDAVELVEFATKRYADKHESTEGVSADSLTVVPSSDGSVWQIHRMDQGYPRPVENVADSVFTPSQFADFRNLQRLAEEARVLQDRDIVTRAETVGQRLVEGERRLGGLATDLLAVLATGVRSDVPPEEMKQRREDVKRMIRNVGLTGTMKDFAEASRLLGTDTIDLISSIPSKIRPPLERGRQKLESASKSFEESLRTILGQGKKAEPDAN